MLCRAVVELCSTVWTYTKPWAVYWRYRSDRQLQRTIPLLEAPWPPSLRDAGLHRIRLVSYIVRYSHKITYGRVRSFFSVVLLVTGPVFFRLSANTAVLAHVHSAANPYPKGNFLSAERGSNPWYHAWIPLPRVPLVYVSQRLFFLSRLFVWYQYVFMRYPVCYICSVL